MTSDSKLVGKLIMWMASKGHFLEQIPQPIHKSSEIKAILDSGVTSIQSLPKISQMRKDKRRRRGKRKENRVIILWFTKE